jgi:hypothetical protein
MTNLLENCWPTKTARYRVGFEPITGIPSALVDKPLNKPFVKRLKFSNLCDLQGNRCKKSALINYIIFVKAGVIDWRTAKKG